MTIVDPVSLAQARLTLPPTADPARVRAILDEQADAVPGRVADRPGPGTAVAEVTAEGTDLHRRGVDARRRPGGRRRRGAARAVPRPACTRRASSPTVAEVVTP